MSFRISILFFNKVKVPFDIEFWLFSSNLDFSLTIFFVFDISLYNNSNILDKIIQETYLNFLYLFDDNFKITIRKFLNFSNSFSLIISNQLYITSTREFNEKESELI